MVLLPLGQPRWTMGFLILGSHVAACGPILLAVSQLGLRLFRDVGVDVRLDHVTKSASNLAACKGAFLDFGEQARS